MGDDHTPVETEEKEEEGTVSLLTLELLKRCISRSPLVSLDLGFPVAPEDFVQTPRR
jgi:hypothetical protein